MNTSTPRITKVVEDSTTVRLSRKAYQALLKFKSKLEQEEGRLVSLGEAIEEAAERAIRDAERRD